jgi:hypothetical protein
MSVSNDSTVLSTIAGRRALLSSTFLEFCAKVRNIDPSILPELGKPFKIRKMCEREHKELADALLENTNVTYLELERNKYTKISAEAMAKYVRTSKHLQRFRWNGNNWTMGEEIICCFCLQFKKARRLRNLTFNCLSLVGRPTWRTKAC